MIGIEQGVVQTLTHGKREGKNGSKRKKKQSMTSFWCFHDYALAEKTCPPGPPGPPGPPASTCMATFVTDTNIQIDLSPISVPWIDGPSPLLACSDIVQGNPVTVPPGSRVYVSGVLLVEAVPSPGTVVIEVVGFPVSISDINGSASIAFGLSLQLGATDGNIPVTVRFDNGAGATATLIAGSSLTVNLINAT